MTVIRMPPRSSLERIRDWGIRAAAERFEAETGERLSDQFDLAADQGVLGLYLLMRGYSPHDGIGRL